jgi:hypothetical protein
MYAFGPVSQLHEAQGVQNRLEWLRDHINLDEEYLDHYQHDYNTLFSQISEIPQDIPITIWIGENAHEQTALRFVLYLLKEKLNDIYLVNTVPMYKRLFDTPNLQHELLHSGEISPERWRILYESTRNHQPISQITRNALVEDWLELAASREVLRIWKGKSIISVEKDYYDDYVINTAVRLHKKQREKDFMKSARLIGELIGHLDDHIGDQFFEYRVRELILSGVFEIKGVPKAMRFYSVKLKEKG